MLALLSLAAVAAEPVVVDPAVDWPLVIGVGAVGVALQLGEDRLPIGTALPADEPRGIDRLGVRELRETPARWSDLLLAGAVVGGAGVSAVGGGAGTGDQRLLVWTEAVLITGTVTEVVKVAARRPRPYVYEGRTGSLDDDLSFFSGHTSLVAASAFAAARTWDLAHDETGAQRVVVYGVPVGLTAATATLRVAAGKHWPSDVLVGAAVGGAVGWLVPELHRASRADSPVAETARRPPVLAVTIEF